MLVAAGLLLLPESARPVDETSCTGDCDRSGTVSIDELIKLVRDALAGSSLRCDPSRPPPSIDALVAAVTASRLQCEPEVTYRLTEGSTVIAKSPKGVSPPRTLSGSFGAIRSNPEPPNSIFSLTITKLDFEADGFSMRGGRLGPHGCSADLGVGCVAALSIGDPILVDMDASVAVETGATAITGNGPFAAFTTYPTLRDLVVCGAAPGTPFVSCEAIRTGAAEGYVLTLFATPNGDE